MEIGPPNTFSGSRQVRDLPGLIRVSCSKGILSLSLATVPVAPLLADGVSVLPNAPILAELNEVEACQKHGPEATPRLCELLSHQRRVRRAAALALAEVGDERAIEPLRNCLRATFPFRSVRFAQITRIATPVMLVVAVVCYLGYTAHTFLLLASSSSEEAIEQGRALKHAADYVLFTCVALAGIPAYCRRVGILARAPLVTALARVAERNPGVNIALDLPFARYTVGEPWTLTSEERIAMRAILRRLEASVSDLPLPNTIPKDAGLPRATCAPSIPTVDLPRCAGSTTSTETTR